MFLLMQFHRLYVFRNMAVANANIKNRSIRIELARLENDELPSSTAIPLIFLPINLRLLLESILLC